MTPPRIIGRLVSAVATRLDRAAEWLHRVARWLRGEPAPEGPNVCPGCYAVAEPCASWCVDAEMRREDEERESRGDDDEGEPDVFASDDIPY